MTALVSNFTREIFRAYDIRGAVAAFEPRFIAALGQAFAEHFLAAGQQQLVLGYDARLSSPHIALSLATQLRAVGLEVIELGCCATPVMYFYARQYAGNGIMVTASHNPKSDNGLKWVCQGFPPPPESIQALADVAQARWCTSSDSTSNLGSNASSNPAPQSYSIPVSTPIVQHKIDAAFCDGYSAALQADIKLQRGFKVVLDAMHGSAGHCAHNILRALGCDVIALRCTPNGDFPDHAPDPSHAPHLAQLQQAILAHQADVGIALDGDGDRLVMLDEQGRIISPDRLLCICAEMCLREHPQKTVVFDVKCSSLVRDCVAACGGRAEMIRTGSSFLRRKILNSAGQAVFGGEYAGHYVFNDGRGLSYDDGLYAALRVLEYWSAQAVMPLSQLFARYADRPQTADTYIATCGYAPKQVFAQLAQAAAQLDAQLDVQLCQIDGIRLDFRHGFGLIRASNTGDYFTLRFDANSPAALAEIQQQMMNLLAPQFPKLVQEYARVVTGEQHA